VQLPGDDTPEARVAEGVVELLARELGHALPAGDVAFVTMLLRPESDEEFPHDRVGVVVVAHGQVASAMTDVAHALTGVHLAKAIDMPLDQDPSAIQELLTQQAKQGQFPGGLLLMVDMGSLEAMGQEVSQRTGVPVRTIGMASSPLVVEAVYQASLPGATLDQVYQATHTCRSLMLSRDSTEELPQVILTFCFTGVGSAHTLAKMVKEALQQHARRVDVIPASISAGRGWSRLVSTLLQSHRLLAVVGPINPRLPGVPYVSTEEVVGRGWRRLRQIVEEGTGARESTPTEQPASAGSDYTSIFGQMAVSLGEHLKVTNPAATIPVIAKGLNAIEQYLGAPITDELRVGLMMHLVCLVERKARDRLVNDSLRDVPVGAYEGYLSWLPEALREITAMFHVRFSDDELERLDEIISQSVSIPE
jgi:transcriptional regulatory protein LevR